MNGLCLFVAAFRACDLIDFFFGFVSIVSTAVFGFFYSAPQI